MHSLSKTYEIVSRDDLVELADNIALQILTAREKTIQ